MDKRKLEIGVSYEEFLYVLHSFAILYQFIVHLLSTTICMSHSHLSIKMFESPIKLKMGWKEIKMRDSIKVGSDPVCL